MAKDKEKKPFVDALRKGWSGLDLILGGMLPGGRDPFWKKGGNYSQIPLQQDG